MEKKTHAAPMAACLAVCAGILAVIGAAAIATAVLSGKENSRMQTYLLGEADACGYIGVSISYDKRPVDIILYGPDGASYKPNSVAGYYQIDKKEKTETFLVDSDKLGTWSAAFNTKGNKKLGYSFVQKPSETLYMTKPVIQTGEGGAYFISLSTTMQCTKGETAVCSAYLEKTGFSYAVCYADIPLNETVSVPLTFPEHVFTGEDYRIKIAVNTKNGQSRQSTLAIHMGFHSPEPSVTEGDADQDGGEEDAESN